MSFRFQTFPNFPKNLSSNVFLLNDTYCSDNDDDDDDGDGDAPTIMMLSSVCFQKELDTLNKCLDDCFPSSVKFGAVASTVSSLTQGAVFVRGEGEDETTVTSHGLVGMAMRGDLQAKVMLAMGARSVGPEYRVIEGSGATVKTIALDDRVKADAKDGGGEEADAISKLPKPVLAEANMLIKRLTDKEQAFMKRALLVGLETDFSGSDSVGGSPSEFQRLAEGGGHSYLVRQVASAGMRDGSVTLPKGSVSVEQGMSFRFFVRDEQGAKDELEALWTGYKKSSLEEAFSADAGDDGEGTFKPAAVLVFPTMDRGKKLFGEDECETLSVTRSLGDTVPKFGFFGNSVFCAIDERLEDGREGQTQLFGSAGMHVVLGPKSARPIQRMSSRQVQSRDEDLGVAAPRDSDGELIIRRREVQSGRAIAVSTIEWSVAEKATNPTSKLEDFMWQKETEIDRLRERNPLANVLNNYKAFMMNPDNANGSRPSWSASIRDAISSTGSIVIIPELKRTDPDGGILRERYDAGTLAREFASSGATSLSVNCDGCVFGGSLDDVEAAKDSTKSNSKASDVTILASELVLYPYQLYLLRMRGAHAVTLNAAASTNKDLEYMSKISRSLGMGVCLCVNTEAQIERVAGIGHLFDAVAVSNREWEDMTTDKAGRRALSLLNSPSMASFKSEEKNGEVIIMAEGGVGVVGNGRMYIEELERAGAQAAIVGRGMVDRVKL